MQTVAFANYVKTHPTRPSASRRWTALRKEFGLPANTPLGGAGAGADGAAARGGGAQRRAPLAQLSDASGAPSCDKRVEEVNAKFRPLPRATVKDFVDHIDYIVKKIGIDHVGISSDFDGGGGIEGWNDASETFNVTLELVRRGYTEEQIGKIWSGNLLRVMEQVAKIAAQSRRKQAGR